ncbi:MAG: chlorite dismutase family protein [Pseudomonadota bacterium]
MALNIQRQTGIVLEEFGKNADGERISLARRVYMQLLVFSNCTQTEPIIQKLEATEAHSVVYADVNDPQGIGLLFCHEEPDWFVTELRQLLYTEPFINLSPKPALTMFGRTYSIGYEQDLEATLVKKPLEKVANPDLPWAIWYPLRRSGAFEQLSANDQRTILMEHGGIGRAYGRAGHGTDIRLACYGLDTKDNDMVIALLGKNLTLLSKIIERMRKTKQTSQYMASLGPFFVGKVIWQKR